MDARQNDDGIERLQQEVEEVGVVMKNNINKVVERGDKLHDLQTRAEDLEMAAGEFQGTTTKIRKKTQWKNRKMTIIIVAIVMVVIIVIILIILAATGTI